MIRYPAAVGSILLAVVLAGAGRGAETKAEPKKSPTAKRDAKGEPAKKGDSEAKEGRVPVHVWADRIRFISADNLALGTGNATAIKNDFRIDCDNLRGILDPKTNKFKKLFAEGDVRMYNILPVPEDLKARPPLQLAPEGRRATCQAAEYDLETEIVVLTGTPEQQPLVAKDKDQVQADRIIYDRKKGLTTFEGRAKLSALVPKKQEGTPGAGPKKPGESEKGKPPVAKETAKPAKE